MKTAQITAVSQIDSPYEWVRLKQEYVRNNAIPVERKTSRQHARWLRLRMMLRMRWQSFTLTERNECERLFGERIDPPGA